MLGISGQGVLHPTRMSGPLGASAVDFADTLVNDFGAQEVWKLTNIQSGTTIPAHVSAARNGSLTGWTLQNRASPVVGDTLLAPLSDGAADFGDILTLGAGSLDDIFDGQTGGIIAWFEVVNAGVWTDGISRVVLEIRVDGSNRLSINKQTTANTLRYSYIAGGTGELYDHAFSSTGWHMVALTWSLAADEVKAYMDGVLVNTAGTLGTFSAGALTRAVIGAQSTVPVLVWSGWLAWYAVRFGSRWSDTDISDIYSEATT